MRKDRLPGPGKLTTGKKRIPITCGRGPSGIRHPDGTIINAATKIFKSGQRITLNGNEGLIYISEG
jgi:hypothetical protein